MFCNVQQHTSSSVSLDLKYEAFAECCWPDKSRVVETTNLWVYLAKQFWKLNLFEVTACMYYLQHERPCCIGYTSSSRSRDIVYPIQHGRECWKYSNACDTNACKRSYSLKILKILNDFGWENRTKRLCKSGGFCITYTNSIMALISVLSFLREILMSILHVTDKTWAPDLYLIYKLEPKASVCISDKDRMRMFYLAYQIHTSK